MHEFIQSLPNNVSFVLALIAIFGYIWMNPPKLKTTFWKKHIVADFDETGHHPKCFNCNEGNDVCYKDSRCLALMDNYRKGNERNSK